MSKLSILANAAWFLSSRLPALKKLEKLKEAGKQEEKYQLLNPMVDELCDEGLRWTKLSLEIEGRENIPDETVVFVANHQSGILDALVMLNLVKGHRPCGFIMKESLGKIPLVRGWTKMIDCVFVDRSNPRDAVRSLNEASDQLAKGISMVIFPEGTRTRQYPVMGEFKNGAFKIAQKNRTPIVPVVIYDTGIHMESSPDGKWRGGTVHMKVLPPVHTATMDRKEYKNLASVLHDQIEAEMMAFYGDQYKKEEEKK